MHPTPAQLAALVLGLALSAGCQGAPLETAAVPPAPLVAVGSGGRLVAAGGGNAVGNHMSNLVAAGAGNLAGDPAGRYVSPRTSDAPEPCATPCDGFVPEARGDDRAPTGCLAITNGTIVDTDLPESF